LALLDGALVAHIWSFYSSAQLPTYDVILCCFYRSRINNDKTLVYPFSIFMNVLEKRLIHPDCFHYACFFSPR